MKKINSGLVVGIIAIIINIITVTVYVYQTNIMQSQQHASVWPYIEWRSVYNQDNGYTLQVRNNGIEPALVKQTSMKLQGKEIEELDTLFSILLGTTRFPHLISDVKNRVIPAGEVINLITIKDKMWSELLFIKLQEENFKFKICYESIYKDQWSSKGVEVEESRCF